MTSEQMDTQTHLGINAPSWNRLHFRKQSTCSPIIQQRRNQTGTGEPGMGAPGDVLLEYYYGGVGDVTNYTYKYNTHSYVDGFGWNTWSLASLAPHDKFTGWNPIKGLLNEQADVSIIFIASNNMRYSEMCDDPVFGAHYQDNSTAPYYATDEYVVPIACSEAYQVCNPNNNKCTPFVGSQQLINATAKIGIDGVQSSETNRLAMAAMLTSVHIQTFTRMSGSLRAAETAAALTQLPLPNNQWQIEVSSWFDTGLARLQQELQDYATGPTNISPPARLWQPGDAVSLAMCNAQLVNDDGSTTSFSVVGLIIIFVVGGLIILTSLVVDSLVGWLQSAMKKGEYKKLNWLLDDKLQLQRMLLEGVGHGTWEGAMDFPRTTRKETFGGWGDIDIQHPSLIPKSAGTLSPWATSQEKIPNKYGTKTTEMLVQEVS